MFFASPEYLLLLLLLIPIVILLFLGNFIRRKQQRRFADLKLLKQLKPQVATWHRYLRNALSLLSLTFLVLALARPQLIRKKEVPRNEKGIECMMVLDISNSMLAEDIRPNRLEFAKLTMLRVMDHIGPSRIGIVVFAGAAYTHLPLTGDLASAKSFVQECNPTMISNQGTAIAPALLRAANSFSDRKDVGKAILLFTDGENHDSDAVDAAKEIASKNVKVFTVATGTTKGALIPFEGSYLKDNQGQAVLTKSNPQFCKDIAHAGNGIALSGSNVSSLSQHIIDELEKLPQAAMEGQTENNEELFGHFLAIAALLLFASFFVSFKKNKLFSKLNLFDR